jgi:succinyl-diaminopimelate desuccinylase
LDLSADIATLTAALIDIPSESHHESDIADSVSAALSAVAHLEVIRIDNNVIATNHNSREEKIILAGHLDTVPVNGNLPHSRNGNVISGLGACDMKGGVAAALHVARHLVNPNRDLTFIFYEAEEVAAEFNGLKKIGERAPEYLDADFAVLMEPSNGNIEAGCQGTLRVEVSTTGERAHSARSWMGRNAIHQVHEILEILDKYQPEQPVIDGLTYREGLNAVAITGGIAGNVIPDRCTVTVNYRFAPNKTEQDAIAFIESLFGRWQVTVTDCAPGALPGLDQPAARAFMEATGARTAPKFGWTDVARFSQMKTPAVNYGPGDPSLAHSQGECVSVDQVQRVADTLITWLSD